MLYRVRSPSRSGVHANAHGSTGDGGAQSLVRGVREDDAPRLCIRVARHAAELDRRLIFRRLQICRQRVGDHAECTAPGDCLAEQSTDVHAREHDLAAYMSRIERRCAAIAGIGQVGFNSWRRRRVRIIREHIPVRRKLQHRRRLTDNAQCRARRLPCRRRHRVVLDAIRQAISCLRLRLVDVSRAAQTIDHVRDTGVEAAISRPAYELVEVCHGFFRAITGESCADERPVCGRWRRRRLSADRCHGGTTNQRGNQGSQSISHGSEVKHPCDPFASEFGVRAGPEISSCGRSIEHREVQNDPVNDIRRSPWAHHAFHAQHNGVFNAYTRVCCSTVASRRCRLY